MPQTNYTYPNLTISTRLIQLEYYLGYKVFVKQKGQNKIELTESVEVFLPLAKEYKKITDAMKEGESKSNKKKITMAATNSIMQSILFRYIANLQKQDSNILFESRSRHSVEIFDDVYEDKIDIGISLKKFKYTGIETIKLLSIPFYIFKLYDENKKEDNPFS